MVLGVHCIDELLINKPSFIGNRLDQSLRSLSLELCLQFARKVINEGLRVLKLIAYESVENSTRIFAGISYSSVRNVCAQYWMCLHGIENFGRVAVFEAKCVLKQDDPLGVQSFL